ncbi:MAG: hypothetical protein KAY37_01130 [Phycisphaerae bacterium]|nr:hypothetical protein [Phycisphaerae bacterium]
MVERSMLKGMFATILIVSMPLVGGCSLSPWLISPPEIPDELIPVLSEPNLFTEDYDDPLHDVEVGTVIDDLSGLSGCWGNVTSLQSTLPGRAFDTYQTLSIDYQSGKASWLIYTDILGFVSSVIVQSGSFSTVGENQVLLELTEYMMSDPSTGELGQREVLDNVRLKLMITLSSDRLKVLFLPGDDSLSTDANEELYGEAEIFKRFECPE